jgi:hypothetical protein
MSTQNFRNTRYSLTETAILSQSTWEENGAFRFAVAVLRKNGKSWDVDGSTAIEGAVWAKSDSEAAQETAESQRLYGIIDTSKPLIEAEMGEAPVRFYRDNLITGRRKRSA